MIKRSYFYHAHKRGADGSVKSWANGFITITSVFRWRPTHILERIKSDIAENGSNGQIVEVTAFNRVK